MNHFPKKSSLNVTRPMYFEKSATYFASGEAVIRIKALLPDVKLIAILPDPGLRAYSCFQVIANISLQILKLKMFSV